MSHLCRYSLLLSLILISLAGFSQTSHIDSLKKVLASLPPEGRSFASDTVRVMVLCELGKGKDKKGLFVGNYKQCIAWLNKAETLAKKINWNKGLLIANMYAGTWHSWTGNELKALQKKQKAVYHAEIEKNNFHLARAYRYLGDSYFLLKSYNNAISYYKKALLPAQLGHYGSLLVSMENIGNIYLEKGDTKNAKYWLEKAYSLAKSYKNEQNLKYITLNLAEVYLALKDSIKLTNTLKEYVSIKFEDKAWDVHFYNVSAKRYLHHQDTKKALIDLISGLAYISKANSSHQKELRRLLALVYEKLGDEQQALINYKQYLNLQETEQQEFQRKQIEYLQYEYQNLKQKDEILILNQEKQQQIRTQKTLWGGILLSILVLSLAFWNNRILSKKNHQIEHQKNQLAQLKEQLSIKNQQLEIFNNDLETTVQKRTYELTLANEELIRKNTEIKQAFLSGKTQERKRVASELHDNLGSTISGLIWQLHGIMPNNLPKNEQYIYDSLIQNMQNAYQEIRHISHHLLPSELDSGLIKALEKLINDRNRNNKIKFSLIETYSQNWLTKSQEVELYSICLEITTNTLKHSQASECTIKITESEGQLYISLNDNGKGMDLKNLGKRGRGLANIEERVKSLGGTLSIHSQPDQGASFKIIVPKA